MKMRMLLLLQEVDEDSKRSYNINQVSYLDKELGLNSILAIILKLNIFLIHGQH